MNTSKSDQPALVRLRASDQANAEVYLQGGHVTSWLTPDGRERLFLSRTAKWQEGVAIRGGVPVIFPQFSDMGSLAKHGFARITSWRDVGEIENGASSGVGHFQLVANESTRETWPHDFLLDLFVTVGGSQLVMVMQVTNRDQQPFEFTACLHTYLRVDDIAQVVVEGLGGLNYTEFNEEATQAESSLRVVGEVDRRYWGVPGPVMVRDGKHSLTVLREGFPDVVVWNPGAEGGARIFDLEPEGYRRMLCIEPAAIGRPIRLEPQQVWRGTQTIIAG